MENASAVVAWIRPLCYVETAMDQAIAVVIALLVGYLFAATTTWVWCPGWLKRFVLGEKRRSHTTLY